MIVAVLLAELHQELIRVYQLLIHVVVHWKERQVGQEGVVGGDRGVGCCKWPSARLGAAVCCVIEAQRDWRDSRPPQPAGEQRSRDENRENMRRESYNTFHLYEILA